MSAYRIRRLQGGIVTLAVLLCAMVLVPSSDATTSSGPAPGQVRVSLASSAGQQDWTPSEPPVPFGFLSNDVRLNSTACASVSLCVSVGSASAGDNTYPLVETYSGGTWTASLAETPPSRDMSLIYGSFESVSVPRRRAVRGCRELLLICADIA